VTLSLRHPEIFFYFSSFWPLMIANKEAAARPGKQQKSDPLA